MQTESSVRGFSLIELLVVIAIIGILSSIVLTSLSSSRSKARTASVEESIHSLQVAAHVCMNDGETLNTPLETINGGAGPLCPNSQSSYMVLPPGWIFCDANAGTQADGDWGNDIFDQTGSTFALYAESNIDATQVRCSEGGCVTSTSDVD